MSIPVSSGIGTGDAQVFTQDKTYDALKDAANTHLQVAEYKNKVAAQKKKEEEEAKKQNLENNIKLMESTKVDYKNILEEDVPLVQKSAQDFQEKWVGRYAKIMSEPALFNEFYKDKNNFEALASNRINAKTNYLKKEEEVTINNPSKYEQSVRTGLQEQRKLSNQDYSTPAERKLNLPSLESSIKFFNPDVFYVADSKVVSDSGTYYKSGGRVSDEKGLEIWKSGLMSAGDEGIGVINNVNHLYKDLNEKEKWKAAYNVFKETRLPEADKNIVNTTNKDNEKTSDTVNKNVPTLTPFTKGGENGMTFNNAQGGNPKPIEFKSGKNKKAFLIDAVKKGELALKTAKLRKENDANIEAIQDLLTKAKDNLANTKETDTTKETSISLYPVNMVKKGKDWWLSGYGAKTVYNEATGETNTIKQDDITRNLTQDPEATARLLDTYEASSLDELYDRIKWSNK